MTLLKSRLFDLDLQNKRVLVRADLNVPLHGTTIVHDHRLRAVLPTLNLIQSKGGKIILMTHIGRPTSWQGNLSTSLLEPWFIHHGYQIEYVADPQKAYDRSLHNQNTILMLENLRFFPGEKKEDNLFALQLARLGDYYVNDAFATLHRTDTSVALVPTLFPQEKRSIGLLVQQELQALYPMAHHPKKPYILLLGGGKIADKLPFIEAMVDRIDVLMVLPAITGTFLKAMGRPVGKSLVDETSVQRCKDILDKAHANNVAVLMPLDYQIAHGSFTGPLSMIPDTNIPPDGVPISIGPKTVAAWAHYLQKAQTIFYNGLCGTVTRPETLDGFKKLLDQITTSKAYTIIGGGDSVAATQLLGYADRISYLSTGGGATLAYLAHQTLPGLEPYLK